MLRMADEKLDRLYPRLLGAVWERVYPAVRALHMTGTLEVEEGRHGPARGWCDGCDCRANRLRARLG